MSHNICAHLFNTLKVCAYFSLERFIFIYFLVAVSKIIGFVFLTDILEYICEFFSLNFVD